MSRQLTTQQAKQQQLQQQKQYAQDVETQEHHAKAEASAGLNLNIFGALAGAFSSKSRKTTQKNKDGSEVSVEDRHDQGMANAAARGQGSAYAKGSAEEYAARKKGREIEQGQTQGKMVEGKKTVDHLGIEG